MTFRWHLMQIGRALSRLFNAMTGGEGDTTTSAFVYRLSMDGGRKLGLPGSWWVAFVDWLLREPGHCRDAYFWHLKRGLFQDDVRPQEIQGGFKPPVFRQIVLDGDRYPLGTVLVYQDMSNEQRRTINAADPLAAIYDDAFRPGVIVFVPAATIPRASRRAGISLALSVQTP